CPRLHMTNRDKAQSLTAPSSNFWWHRPWASYTSLKRQRRPGSEPAYLFTIADHHVARRHGGVEAVAAVNQGANSGRVLDAIDVQHQKVIATAAQHLGIDGSAALRGKVQVGLDPVVAVAAVKAHLEQAVQGQYRTWNFAQAIAHDEDVVRAAAAIHVDHHRSVERNEGGAQGT